MKLKQLGGQGLREFRQLRDEFGPPVHGSFKYSWFSSLALVDSKQNLENNGFLCVLSAKINIHGSFLGFC